MILNPVLYRRRLIPNECILLKDDVILSCTDNMILTKWNALRPKKELHHGFSAYFLKEHIKVSKFCKEDNTFMYWYCDVVDYETDESAEEGAAGLLQKAEEEAAAILEQAKADAKAMKQQAQEKSRQLDKKQEDSIRQQEAVLKEDQETNSSAEIAGMRQAALQNEKDAIAAILENLV